MLKSYFIHGYAFHFSHMLKNGLIFLDFHTLYKHCGVKDLDFLNSISSFFSIISLPKAILGF